MGRLIMSLFAVVGMVLVGLLAVAVGLFAYDEYRRSQESADEPDAAPGPAAGEPDAAPEAPADNPELETA